jgi:aspartate racemase
VSVAGTLGLIGGITPASTIDYYRSLVAAYQRERPNQFPSILINSIDLTRLLDLVGRGRLGELTDWLSAELERLARGGATFALMTSNTPHLVYDELSARAPVPLLSIVEAAADAAAAFGLRELGILGTRFTMEGGFYEAVFGRRAMRVRRPAGPDLEYVHETYMHELIPGRFLPESRAGILAVIDRLADEGADGVLLAGTELPLLLGEEVQARVPVLDTTRIHVRRAVSELLR